MMFKPNLTKGQLLDIVDSMSELEIARFLFCQEIGGTYLAVSKFEDMLITAMHMCDRIKLEKALGPEMDRWKQSLTKQALLQGSTLGALIKILERHGVSEADIGYLTWIKGKRDYFIHRFFHDGGWPGDLDGEGCRAMCRQLLALQHWLSRAEQNIWLIFERAGFVELNQLEDGSLLATNTGVYDILRPDAAG